MPTTDTAKTVTDRWGRIPAWWLDHPDLDADGLAVLAALSTFADEHGVCWPSQTTLAEKLKRSRPTINRILQRLSDLGLVTIEHRRGRDGARLSCRYHVRFEHEQTAEKIAVQPADRDDSPAYTPCSAASQEQPQPEQIPDSRSKRTGEVHCVPEDWMPSADDLAWAKARFPSLDLAGYTEKFTLRCKAHDYRYRDVGAAWRSWLAEDALRRPTAKPTVAAVAPRSREAAAEQSLNAWMSAALVARNTPPRPRIWL